MKKFIYLLVFAVLVSGVLISAKIVNADLTKDVPVHELKTRVPSNEAFSIKSCIGEINDSGGYKFDEQRYLKLADIKNIISIRNQLAEMDSITNNPSIDQSVLSVALTTSLMEKDKNKWSIYTPDSLLVMVQWAEQFRYYATMNPSTKNFYKSVHSYWMNFVTEEIAEYCQEDGSRKYNSKIQYLMTRCAEQKFYTNIRETSNEKFIHHLIRSKFGHLVNSSWNQSSWSLKVGLFACFIIFLLGIITSFRIVIHSYRKFLIN